LNILLPPGNNPSPLAQYGSLYDELIACGADRTSAEKHIL